MKRTLAIIENHDMVNAGGIWLDEAVVVDRNQIASRTPKDLPAFAKALVDQLAGGPSSKGPA